MMDINKIRGIKETYALLRKLSATGGPNISKNLLDRLMFNSEALPPLGKEYWWFLFFGSEGEKPVQLMLMIFRKYGKKMLFNNKEMMLKELGKNKFQGVTTGWLYDGEKFLDLGDTNAVTEIQDKKIISAIFGEKLMFSGDFPSYKLKIGEVVDLNLKKANYLREKDGQGSCLLPFGMGWVNIFLEAEGIIFGKKFKGTAHLQKVLAVTILGPFNWGRIVFQEGSSARFFFIKTGKDSKIYFLKSLEFFDQKNKEIIKLNNPKIEISKKENQWLIEGKEDEKSFKIVLEVYAKKQFIGRGGGSFVYDEYAVIPREFYLKTKERVITLADLGKGVGTFEDAYW